MIKPPTLDETIRIGAYDLFTKAKELIQRREYALAERYCLEAWALIPEPKYAWDSSYICLMHTVSLLRDTASYDVAINLVQDYLRSGHHADYQDGPYFWLGTLHYEKQQFAEAFSYLDRAKRMSRGRCFREEHPRYQAFYNEFRKRGRPN